MLSPHKNLDQRRVRLDSQNPSAAVDRRRSVRGEPAEAAPGGPSEGLMLHG
jgi:hypothetical protein